MASRVPVCMALGEKWVRGNTGRQEVRMSSEVEEMAGVIGGAGCPHMRTAGESQNGSGARARAKVSFHRVKVGAGLCGVRELREGGQIPGGPRAWAFSPLPGQGIK